jgi:predicted helicase
MTDFAKCLETFEPEDKAQKGSNSHTKRKLFEHFVKWFLKNDPEWSTQVEEVWLWDDYLDKWGRDCGVDLVFKTQEW